eukprot:3964289-Pleurochrysis_carterae.AAC.2
MLTSAFVARLPTSRSIALGRSRMLVFRFLARAASAIEQRRLSFRRSLRATTQPPEGARRPSTAAPKY